jgi:carbamoyl-phosphate synthase large subunit
VSLIAEGEIDLVINTPQGSSGRMDGYEIRSAVVVADIPCVTTLPGAAAAVMGIEALLRGEMTVPFPCRSSTRPCAGHGDTR